jgi:Fe2+ transport system protein FeoA
MTLNHLNINEDGVIIKAKNNMLQSMGVINGAHFRIINKIGDNFIIKVSNSDTSISITKDVARQINVCRRYQ